MSKKEDILKIRNYFGKHDKTAFEHWAYAFLDEEIKALTRKPTHGNCCTCQECGQSHDDCNCREIETLKNLKGKFDDSFSMIEEREYKTVYLLIAALANIYNEDTNEIIDLLTGHLWDEEDAANLKQQIK